MKSSGISDALWSFTESVLNAKDNKEQVMGLFLDLSKAFDMVNHKILIKKLHKIGLRGLAEEWFVSYFSNRRQLVEVGSSKSNTINIEHGVPQGSILGPVLFLLYINDLPLNTPQADIFLFADDTNIVFNSINRNDIQVKINETTIKIEQWLIYNKLKINIDKTVYIHFNQSKSKLYDPVLLNNTVL